MKNTVKLIYVSPDKKGYISIPKKKSNKKKKDKT